jgi:sugar phosphate isomerase/epimerase
MATRRDFLTSTAASASLLLTPLKDLSAPFKSKPTPGFSVTIMGTNWGFAGTWEEFGSKVKKEGYEGVEVWWPGDEKNRNELLAMLSKYNLKVGFLYGSGESDFTKHEAQFHVVIEATAKTKPLYINCHSSKDYFTVDQKSKLINFTTGLSSSSGVPIYHETHRGRACYSATVTRELIEKIPELRLTLDISHWCNVHESLLQDQEETVALALSRTDHIHARIGHAEGPQVNDPRAPEWESAVKAHFAWWDNVVERKRKEGKAITFLTEFGPPHYLPALPYSQQPVANQWDINVYMLQMLRKRYS